MDLWERGQHAGLVGYAEAEGAAQEGRAASRSKEEDEAVAQSYHKTVLSGKLRAMASLSSLSLKAALPSWAAPSASAPPTRPA